MNSEFNHLIAGATRKYLHKQIRHRKNNNTYEVLRVTSYHGHQHEKITLLVWPCENSPHVVEIEHFVAEMEFVVVTPPWS